MTKTPPPVQTKAVGTTPPPIHTGGGCESFRPLVSQYDWNVDIALAVMKAESGCRATATNQNTDGSNDAGLFQINSIHVVSGLISDTARFDPAQNVHAAYAIYRGGGWHAWASYTSGSYQKYLN